MKEENRQHSRPLLLSRKPLAEGKWIRLEQLHYRDSTGRERIWELATRQQAIQAVCMIASCVPTRQWVLIRQFRPPAGRKVLEFPAGLIHPTETVENAAVREFLEETGFHLQIQTVHPPVFNSPGLTDEAAWIVTGQVDLQTPENQHPRPRPDPGEEIEVILVGQTELERQIQIEFNQGHGVDAKVLLFALGQGLCWAGETQSPK